MTIKPEFEKFTDHKHNSEMKRIFKRQFREILPIVDLMLEGFAALNNEVSNDSPSAEADWIEMQECINLVTNILAERNKINRHPHVMRVQVLTVLLLAQIKFTRLHLGQIAISVLNVESKHSRQSNKDLEMVLKLLSMEDDNGRSN